LLRDFEKKVRASKKFNQDFTQEVSLLRFARNDGALFELLFKQEKQNPTIVH